MSVLTMIKNNKAMIATIVGVVGYGVSLYVEYKRSPKIPQLMREAEEKKGGEPLTKKEKAVVYIKAQWPVAVLGMASTALISWGYKIQKNFITEQAEKLTTSAALLSASQAKMAEYQKKVIEKVGEKTEAEIHDAIMEDHTKNAAPAFMNKNVFITGQGTTHFREEITGVMFDSSIEAVMDGVRKLNRDVVSPALDSDGTLDALLDYWMIPSIGSYQGHGKIASRMGWLSTGHNSVNGETEGDEESIAQYGGPIIPRFSSCLLENNEPVTTIDWYIQPIDLEGGVS